MRWLTYPRREIDPAFERELKEKLLLPDYIQSVMVNRGIDTFEKAREAFEIDSSPLIPATLLDGVDKAVSRIAAAVEKKEKITIYGDYDVDGVSAIVILYKYFAEFLKYTGVDYYIPHRQDEGYGLNIEALKSIKESGASLIITVDCGISAAKEALFCAENGMDLIVTDHHVPSPENIPRKAAAIINPKLSKAYESSELSGAGTAYKLVLAMEERFKAGLKDEFLDFAALGTVADVVPLSLENRKIIRKGLKKLVNPANKGLRALKAAAGLKEGAEVTSFHVGFILGPRINAAGRLEHAKKAVNLFLSQDGEEIKKIAAELNETNEERKKLMQQAEEEACEMLEKSFKREEDFVIVLYNNKWNAGIVGLVASRILNKYNRPAFILTKGEDNLVHGSARSLQTVDVYDVISHASSALEKFGGHRLAAGVTLKEENIGKFREAMNLYLKKTKKPEDFEPSLLIDAQITGEISLKEVKTLSRLEPWGEGNPKPVFTMEGAEVKDVKLFKGNTMKFYAKHKGRLYNFIKFRYSQEDYDNVKQGAIFDIAFTPSINVWNNEESMVMEVKDYK